MLDRAVEQPGNLFRFSLFHEEHGQNLLSLDRLIRKGFCETFLLKIKLMLSGDRKLIIVKAPKAFL